MPFVATVDVIQQQLKQIRLRIPQEGSVTRLGFSHDVTAMPQQCCLHAAKVMETLQDLVKASLQQIALGGGKRRCMVIGLYKICDLGK